MSEKTEKPKVRTVIGTGTVVKNDKFITINLGCGDQQLPMSLAYQPIGLRKMQPGTKIEIVAVREVEPERELVRGPGEWKKNEASLSLSHDFINNRGVLATVWTGRSDNMSKWWWVIPGMNVAKHAATFELAQRAAEEAKATSEEDGFRWKEVEPEYIRYMVTAIYKDGDKTWKHPSSKYNAEVYFNGFSDCRNTTITVLAAQDKQLNWHELDRHETSNE